jgi:hypothetical protein
MILWLMRTEDVSSDGMTFGPVSMHYPPPPRHFTTEVKDPMKIFSKGVPSKKKRWRSYLELWRIN